MKFDLILEKLKLLASFQQITIVILTHSNYIILAKEVEFKCALELKLNSKYKRTLFVI